MQEFLKWSKHNSFENTKTSQNREHTLVGKGTTISKGTNRRTEYNECLIRLMKAKPICTFAFRKTFSISI